MQIRLTKKEDLPKLLAIYEHARQYMVQHDNPNQWGKSKPSTSQVIKDIENKKSYVCVDDNDQILGVFYFSIEEDPTYNFIEGKWINNNLYGVVHRIAVGVNTKGVGSFCLNWAYDKCTNLRIDTHEKNIPMKSLLKKLGFQYCGIIYISDGTPREAYQKIERR